MKQAPARRAPDWRVRGAVLLVLLVTLAVYLPVLRHGFVEWDDPYYVTENVHVRSGLTASGVVWAFTSHEYANWHPLTWLSHMLDASLYGLAPGGHHLTSVLLHLANTLLLFVALKRLTRAPWRSLAVAALFALHPLHVESVAWISERKDVLSTTFWLAALWAYARYAERPGAARYALVAAAFALGLMAKPMLVSLPLTLLILDGWPLRRVGAGRLADWWPRVLEKLPLVAMSLAVSALAWLAQRSAGAISDTPLTTRLANAVLGYAGYLAKTVWPAGLAAFYPYRLHPPLGEAAVALFVLLLLSAAAWLARRRGYVLAGWLWYLVTLLPVIGIVRIGQQAMADRYSYVPLVGVFWVLVWGASEVWSRVSGVRPVRLLAPALVALLAVALVFGASAQVGTWKDGETLWSRAIAVGGNSTVSQNNLGVALFKANRLDEAALHFTEAVRLEPKHARAYFNLGDVRLAQGRNPEAIAAYESALRVDPGYAQAQVNLAKAHYNLGNSRWRDGHLDDAVIEYREAVRSNPGDAGFRRALGMALAQQGKSDEALTELQESLRLDPENPATHDALAMTLFERGDYAGAWREVQASRVRGGTPAAALLEGLGQRMPEPK